MGMEFSIIHKMVRKHICQVTLEQSPKRSEGWSHVAVWGNGIPGRRRGKKRPRGRSIVRVLEEPPGGQRLEQGREGQSGRRGGHTGGTGPDHIGLCRLL